MARNRPSRAKVSAYLRHLVREHMAATSEKPAQLAKQAEVSKGMMSMFLSEERGAGADLLSGLSKVLGVTIDQIEKDSGPWAAEHPDLVAKEPTADRYPTRAHTVAWAKKCGFPPAAIKQLQSWRFEGDDPGGEYWAKLLAVLAQQPTTPLGSPIQTEGEPPQSTRLHAPPKRAHR